MVKQELEEVSHNHALAKEGCNTECQNIRANNLIGPELLGLPSTDSDEK